MNLLEQLLNAQGGGAVKQLAQNFGLDESQAQSAIGALLPTLAGSMRNQAGEGGSGLDSLLSGLSGAGADRFLNDPSQLGSTESVDMGNGILGQLLGSKDVSRELANKASAQTGIGVDVLKQMLPLVASLAAGALSQRSNLSPGNSMAAGAGVGGGGNDLLSMLDFNKDGSSMDDILGMATKFLRK